jgi:hypothetical protein
MVGRRVWGAANSIPQDTEARAGGGVEEEVETVALERGGEGVELVCALDWWVGWLGRYLDARGGLRGIDASEIEVIGRLLTAG